MASINSNSNPEEQMSLEEYEEKNVHQVYQQIAQHFSSTRYKVCLCTCT